MSARHALGWADLAGRAVGVWGMGVEGAANRRKLATLGVDPVLVDDRPPAGGAADGLPDRPVLATADGGLEALRGCEVVVKTPGISRHRADVAALEAAGVPVVGGLGLWLQEADRRRVVGITGTKGKSTTTTVLGHLLTGLGRRPFVGGNIGRPPYDPLAQGDHDVWVIEVSSYQATDLAVAPGVVCVTSLSPDHLPWHGDVATYYREKLSICTLPGPHVVLANGVDAELRRHADLLGPDVRWVEPPDERPRWLDALGLLGAHNDANALLAAACIQALAGGGRDAARVGGAVDEAALERAAAGMAGLPSRLQPVAELDGVLFVDDSLATNVLPTAAALAAFPDRAVALLVGGEDRGIDYGPLADAVRSRAAETLVLGLPTNGPRILAAVEAAGGVGPRASAEPADDLPAAVARAFDWARPRGGAVLLSPAAPSFDRFRDYAHRGEVFSSAARSLAKPRQQATRSGRRGARPGR